MQSRPFKYQGKDSPRKNPANPPTFNLDTDFPLTEHGVKMCDTMFLMIHRDHESTEAAEFRHAATSRHMRGDPLPIHGMRRHIPAALNRRSPVELPPHPHMTARAVVIRDATIADAPQVAALLAELGYPTSAEIMSERLRAFIDAGEIALMAFDGEHAVGFMSLHLTPVLHRPTAVGRITAMVVTEQARGQRIGQQLVEAGERMLAERGCALVEVTSNRVRTDAHRFYERLGYLATSFKLVKSLQQQVLQVPATCHLPLVISSSAEVGRTCGAI